MLLQRSNTISLLALSFVKGVHSNNLVNQGFKLVQQSSDSSKLTTGGSSQGASYYSNGECKSIKYVDTCSDLEGTRFYERDGLDGVYVINGETVTKCNKYRSEWQCNQCFMGSCTFTSGDNHGGSTTTYKLVPAPGEIASLSNIDDNGYCYEVCTNSDGTIAIGHDSPEDKCGQAGGWYLVDTSYDTPCDISNTHECKEEGRSCDSFSLTKGWSDDCCPGSYCRSDRCRENPRNERMCKTTNQPCGSDVDCCVGYVCKDFVYQSAAKACERVSDDCTQESWKPDEDEPCCEGTKEAEMTDEDGETVIYCKAIPQAVAAIESSSSAFLGSGAGDEAGMSTSPTASSPVLDTTSSNASPVSGEGPKEGSLGTTPTKATDEPEMLSSAGNMPLVTTYAILPLVLLSRI